VLKYCFSSNISRIELFLCLTVKRHGAVWYACGMCEGLSGRLYIMKT